MKKIRIRILVCLTAAVFCTAAFSVSALAYSEGKTSSMMPQSSSSPAPGSPASSEASSGTSSKPLTPDGAGTVIDNVTNEDGKEFFTVTTPSKHVFYLVIDRQKDSENVYFLDSVTEKDLLALAKSDNKDIDDSPSSGAVSNPEASSAPTASTPASSAVSQPKKQSNGGSSAIAAVAVLAAVLVGGAIWFFKFRKPGKKDKNRPDPDDYDYTDDGDEESEPEVPDEETEQKGESEREDE
ncbi:MAG: DUF4366 domain-containing protein [Oscillospiraceae bacterium]|jgi:cobalamin biosynthesis Mg chelatase CobN|nr:DUF4366 domain-containing protein [Oscillospiraceae bacterium]MCI2035380.1 DUF4366 domain-containing protein [Oscillospiraceae bacterium]